MWVIRCLENHIIPQGARPTHTGLDDYDDYLMKCKNCDIFVVDQSMLEVSFLCSSITAASLTISPSVVAYMGPALF